MVGEAPGVRAAVAGRVAEMTLASSVSTGASVRLVIVDARAYEQLLATSDLPDAPQLERLTTAGGEDAPVPALLLGGPPGLEDGLHVRWGANDDVALDVVGEAPRVDAATDPVIVVDAAAFAAAGARADPDTIWALGPGAPEALHAAAEEDPADTVLTFDEVLTSLRERRCPLRWCTWPSRPHCCSCCWPGSAWCSVPRSTPRPAPPRSDGCARWASPTQDLRRVLAGELVAPVLASVLTGLVVGVATAGRPSARSGSRR